MSSPVREKPDHTTSNSPYDPASTSFAAEDRIECAYSFEAYLRSRAGFVFGVVALMLVVVGILAVTSSNASVIALVSLCEALFACIVLAVGFSRNREFYQQLDRFCNSPDNARYLSSILDEPRTLEGTLAYRALAVQGKAASDELAARFNEIESLRPLAFAAALKALQKLHGTPYRKPCGKSGDKRLHDCFRRFAGVRHGVLLSAPPCLAR